MEITEKRFIVINPHRISTPAPHWCTNAATVLGNNGRGGEEKGGRLLEEKNLEKFRSFPKFPSLLPFAFERKSFC